jgi:hypothetical protein
MGSINEAHPPAAALLDKAPYLAARAVAMLAREWRSSATSTAPRSSERSGAQVGQAVPARRVSPQGVSKATAQQVGQAVPARRVRPQNMERPVVNTMPTALVCLA